MNCKICGNTSSALFVKKVLHKYDVTYYRCPNCLFIQTEEPYWLDEAYKSAINASDIGLIARNIVFSEKLNTLFGLLHLDRTKNYLDYGGGYGMFVRMMRDFGYNFYWEDQYCENTYAKYFAINDLPADQRKFEVITAFEVFEHLADPIKDFEKMLAISNGLLFSTEVYRGPIEQIENWWYIGSEHGQHVSFYSIKSLEYIASKYNLHLNTFKNLHFFTKYKVNGLFYKIASNYKISRMYNTLNMGGSLNEFDFQKIEKNKTTI